MAMDFDYRLIVSVESECPGVFRFDWSSLLFTDNDCDPRVARCLDALCGSPDERREFITSCVNEAGYEVQHLPFHSPFGAGVNLLVLPETARRLDVLFTAHYDGPDWHDNAGGVLFLLDMLRERDSESYGSTGFLFTDMEERWQVGAKAFVKSYCAGEFPFDAIHRVVCIDGFGAGDELMIRGPLALPWRHRTTIFRTDADVFSEFGLRTSSIHSGTECLTGCADKAVPANHTHSWYAKHRLTLSLAFQCP